MGELMRGWERQISPGYVGKAGLLRQALHQMQGTGIALLACLVQTAAAGVDFVMADNFKSMRVPFLVVVGGYSCFIGQVLLLFRRRQILNTLRILTAVCDALEAENGDVKEALRSHASWSRKRTRGFIAYCLVSLVGSLGTMATDESLYTHKAARRFGGPALRWSKCAFDVYATLASHVANFTMMILAQDVFHASAAIYVQLGRLLETQVGEEAVHRNASLSGHIALACQIFNTVFGRLLPHYLLVALLMPMVSTAEVLLTGGKADSFALSTIPFLLFEFMPFCLVGQLLEDTCSDMGFCAYQGPWLEEAVPTRRSRLLVMLSTVRPAFFGLQGLVRLNRETCLDALRVWFQYLQILLNVS